MFPGTLSDDAQNALAVLGKSKLLDFAYMAGGSALALHLGHRQSIDFDFFTETKFNAVQVQSDLGKVGTFTADEVGEDTLLGFFDKVKFSLFEYAYPMIGGEVDFMGVKLASMEDIAAMKLVAVTDRSTKKDFIDLYVLAQQGFNLEEMLGFYDRKYHTLEVNRLTLLKSLQYFEEAEDAVMPVMLTKIDWEEVKAFFRSEVVRLWKKIT